MTDKELNNDVKKLWRKLEKYKGVYCEWKEAELRSEFMRLYRADTQMLAINRKSILILMRINLKFRFVPLHSFGIGMDELQLK